ncbi:hypothetical protein AAG570_008185 [Ranatra chinensis]|uniref:Uncharacterized protein n=1 Tax=Ranatra chinensis TaxID=642074 RepID=A0ABD0XSI8_9HEMI
MLGETQYSSVSEEEIIFDEYYDSMSEHVCPHSDNALLHEDKIDRSSESSNAGEAEFEIGASSEQLSWCSLHIEDEDYGLFGVLPELYPFEEVGEEREYIPNEVLEE